MSRPAARSERPQAAPFLCPEMHAAMRHSPPLAALLLAFALAAGPAGAAPAGTASAAGAAGSAPAVAPTRRAAAEPPGAVRPLGDGYTVRHEALRLPNGFQAILVEDHRLPLVAFNLWVHAGPRNEAVGQTGFAHLFEHLMFAGTRHIPRGEADRLVDAAGGTDYNGSTNFDRTNYYFTLPSNQLELGLWIKADMLGYMIDEVDPVALATQQDVVRNERRQTTENRPYGVADEAVYHALYPQGHPYRAAVIGSHADIQSIRLDDVRAFARTYYRPNNATLVLAGDFEPARARALLRKYFGSLRPGAPVPPVALPPAAADVAISAERRVVVTDRVELPRLTLAWHSTPAYAPGDAELQLAAGVLGGDKSSRLYRKLVYERQIAQSVTAAQYGQALGSVFSIEVVARPGHTLDEIQAAVDEELAALAATPPSEPELLRARRALETQLFGRLETVGGIADLLNEYNQLAGDADYLPKDLARLRAVTPESLRQAVARTLPRPARVAVLAQPGEQVLPPEVPTPPLPETAKRAAGHGVSVNADEPWRRRRPAPGPARPLALPAGDRFALANGLTVVRVARPGVPLVSAALVLRAGQDANPPDRPGLAGFTAALLEDGTQARSATDFAEQVADLGATLAAKAGREDARIEFAGLRSGLADGLGLVADAARNAAFDPAEIERRRAARHAALLQQREDARATVAAVAQRAWYGEGHPLGASPLGDEAALAATTRDDLQGFWRSRYRPDRAALVVAGDVGADELRTLAERLFGGWQPDAAASDAPVRGTAPRPTAARLVLVDKPGTPQTALALVGPGPR